MGGFQWVLSLCRDVGFSTSSFANSRICELNPKKVRPGVRDRGPSSSLGSRSYYAHPAVSSLYPSRASVFHNNVE